MTVVTEEQYFSRFEGKAISATMKEDYGTGLKKGDRVAGLVQLVPGVDGKEMVVLTGRKVSVTDTPVVTIPVRYLTDVKEETSAGEIPNHPPGIPKPMPEGQKDVSVKPDYQKYALVALAGFALGFVAYKMMDR